MEQRRVPQGERRVREKIVESYALIVALAALGLCLGLGIWLLKLQRDVQRVLHSYRALVNDADGHNLEQIIESQLASLHSTALKLNELQLAQHRLEAQLSRSLQGVGLVRFNPFKDTGSDQSFCVALLDGRGDGVVLSSLFGRRDVRVFAKSVAAGASSYSLSEEEEEAIRLAGQGGRQRPEDATRRSATPG